MGDLRFLPRADSDHRVSLKVPKEEKKGVQALRRKRRRLAAVSRRRNRKL